MLLCLVLGQSAPGDFRVGVDDRGNHNVFKGARFAEDRFDGDLTFLGRSMSEQSAAVDIADSVHPHPTLSETLMEAAESFYGTATHTLPRR